MMKMITLVELKKREREKKKREGKEG